MNESTSTPSGDERPAGTPGPPPQPNDNDPTPEVERRELTRRASLANFAVLVGVAALGVSRNANAAAACGTYTNGILNPDANCGYQGAKDADCGKVIQQGTRQRSSDEDCVPQPGSSDSACGQVATMFPATTYWNDVACGVQNPTTGFYSSDKDCGKAASQGVWIDNDCGLPYSETGTYSDSL